MEQNIEILKGTVENITYRNDENGYCVIELATNNDVITVVGILPYINIGEQLAVRGEYIIHPQYGQQFKAEIVERTLPCSTASILKYLASGAIRGIGPATAQTIVARYGEHSLEIIENNCEKLSEIRGISLSKAKKIGEEFSKQFGVREVMLKLSEFNVSQNEALKILKKLGNSSVNKIKNNPYLLCDELGFPFVRADEIALNLDDSVDSDFRVEAGIKYVLRYNLRNGHTCLPKDKLIETAAKLLGCDLEKSERVLESLISNEKLVQAVLNDKYFIFLPKYYKAERYCANRIALMMTVPPAEIAITKSRLEQFERESGIIYDEIQEQAIASALSKGMLVLTGGPGTGKTTTLNAIISLLDEAGVKIALAAPTGRAAKRMSELTGREAKTIHRLLEVEWDENDKQKFKRNERNLLEYNCIVVDELSMMDIELFDALLKAMDVNCRLILVGDVDQLPSVGAGNVLNDIIESGVVPVITLTKVFRQAKQSYIVTNAHKIIAAEMPSVSKDSIDFFVVDNPHPDRLISDLYSKRLPEAYGFTPETIQVLCPSRKRSTGTMNINNILQAIINPPNRMSKKEINRKGFVMREGDKVMQVKNNYDVMWKKDNGEQGTGVFNGDIGVLESIDKATSTLVIKFEDKTAYFTGEDIEDIELAYAITVHKSQGSEFECVILPVCDIPIQLCYRNLLYTAVTRAKKMLIVVGKGADIKRMIDNYKKTQRYTAFKHFLLQTKESNGLLL